MTLQVDIW